MDGIILFYKEWGMILFDCIVCLWWILYIKKVGYLGILDFNVDGVLLIVIGNVIKVVEYLMVLGKEYVGELMIGLVMIIEDFDGEVVD